MEKLISNIGAIIAIVAFVGGLVVWAVKLDTRLEQQEYWTKYFHKLP